MGDNGRPLAIIEAKRTGKEVASGRAQAVLYAQCLEKQFGQRPVIYYTNGFETYMLDDTFYQARQVYGFYTKAELETLVDRRTKRQDLRGFAINTDIAGRPYQLEALQRIAESFITDDPQGGIRGNRRETLLVMATGTGKTRTAAALVDMMTQCNWAKRVLFLADRKALVTQAKKAFKAHLEHLSGIDLTKEKEDKNTRLVFSTYPTIMNKIDSLRNGDERFYGIGHFDLIIIDEAHRSVYQKYKSIFDYFDALLVGLTATPRKDIDRNTYSLFHIEDDAPTFAYELEEAVRDGYLTPPQGLELKLKFPFDGIKYKDLKEKEKEEYEEKFGDPSEGEAPEEIEGGAVNKWLFNNDTQDKILQQLMEKGIKVEEGDRIGKTIIFARNHRHAIFLKERFDKLFPEYDPQFAQVIDNQTEKVESVLEDFCYDKEEKFPQIAISVDMMDTGVDAPRVVNLVFAKLVKSVSKYWQMIGRGTRLCPDLFGPSQDKDHFLIIDCAANFEYYEHIGEGQGNRIAKSLTQQIFEAKVELGYALRQFPEADAAGLALGEQFLTEAHQAIAALDPQRFQVKQEMRYVTRFSQASTWEQLKKVDLGELYDHVSKLIPSIGEEDIDCRRFDKMMLHYQLALLEELPTDRYSQQLILIAKGLRKKGNVPAVSKQMPVIERVLSEAFWEEPTVPALEKVRLALREIVKFIEKETQEIVYTAFKDELKTGDIKIRDTDRIINTAHQLTTYRERVEHYLKQHRHETAIHKLTHNIPITSAELEQLERILHSEELGGNPEELKDAMKDKPLGAFIRSILGLEQSVAQSLFADYLNNQKLTATQMNFINMIVQYLKKNGVMDIGQLYESPFSHIHSDGIDGVFGDQQADHIIGILEQVNLNAGGVGVA
ncbi:DEAD/DEAH box helicase family protein [Persicobacter sp. CCB-QB2]|uniref:type I restriction endonuclease subunit R n=1 Tax=Persicobacter sp. CCB-QB2 TaxID=1561025 RepID=UPI000A77268E|nr:DEAD/DEAH box helicase family protein [Persicobacter sp. CCB-QB2]